MLPQKMFKIRIFNSAENEFQRTKLPDFPDVWNSVTNSLTFWQIPRLSEVSFKFPDFSRFSRSVATLHLSINDTYKLVEFSFLQSLIRKSKRNIWYKMSSKIGQL